MSRKSNGEAEDDELERAPWEAGALTVDVTSVSPEVVLKNCLSDDLPLRLVYIKGLASAATRATKRELGRLLEALEPLLDDEALGVRLETLEQLQQLAKLASNTVSQEQVEEAVVDALEGQLRPSLDPAGPGGAARTAAAGTAALPMVRNALLAALDAVCGELPAGQRNALLMRLLRTANAALDKPASGLGAASGTSGGGAAAGGGGKASGDAALMILSLAAVAVRHLDPDRGGLAMAAVGGRLCSHSDLRVREAVAGALPQLYGKYARHPGALEQMFEAYYTLCNDKVWSVRQACARVAAELSTLCSLADVAEEGAAAAAANAVATYPTPDLQQQQRADELQVRLIRKLFLDTLLPTKSQWVVTAVRQQTGAAIASLRPGLPAAELLPALLEAYCAAATGAVGQGAVDVRRSCAASFADVVAKAGPQRWAQLRPVFKRLLAANDPPALSSMVAAAERVVRLLASAAPPRGDASGSGSAAGGDAAVGAAKFGLDDAAREVVSGPLLEVLRNQLHMVAPAAAAAMAGLLGVCPPDVQLDLLQVLPELCRPPAAAPGRCGDWRPRLSLASQLQAAMRATAAAGPAASSIVATCAVALCDDPVWAVRHAAAVQVGLILAMDAGQRGAAREVDDTSSPTAVSQHTRTDLDDDRSTHGRGGEAVAAASEQRAGLCGCMERLAVAVEERTAEASLERAEDERGAGGKGTRDAVRASQSPGSEGGPDQPALLPGGVRDEAGSAGSSSSCGSPGGAAGGEGGGGEGPGAEGSQGGQGEARGRAGVHEPAGQGSSAAAAGSDPLSRLTRRQRAWLDRQLQPQQLGNGCSGEAGGEGDVERAAAPEALRAWLRKAARQGTRAELALAAACCCAAVPPSR